MAKYWKIEQGGNYVGYGEGDSFTFMFPQNTGNSNVTYTITYEDESGFTASTSYVITACPIVTTCYEITASTINLGADGGSIQLGTSTAPCVDCGNITHSGTITFTSGGTYNGNFSYSPSGCYPSINKSSYSWIKYIVVNGDGTLRAEAEMNTNTVARSGVITFNGENITVTQAAGSVQHSCNDITVHSTEKTVNGSSASNWKYTDLSLPSDFTGRTIISKPTWVTGASVTDSSLLLSYTEYSDVNWDNGKGGGNNVRSGSIKVQFRNLITACTKTVKLNQFSCGQFVCLNFARDCYADRGGTDFYIFDESFGDGVEDDILRTIDRAVPFASSYNWGNSSPLLTYKFNPSTQAYVDGSMVLQPNVMANVVDPDSFEVSGATALTIVDLITTSTPMYTVIGVSVDRQKIGRFKQGGTTWIPGGGGVPDIHGLFQLSTYNFKHNGFTVELTDFSDAFFDY